MYILLLCVRILAHYIRRQGRHGTKVKFLIMYPAFLLPLEAGAWMSSKKHYGGDKLSIIADPKGPSVFYLWKLANMTWTPIMWVSKDIWQHDNRMPRSPYIITA